MADAFFADAELKEAGDEILHLLETNWVFISLVALGGVCIILSVCTCVCILFYKPKSVPFNETQRGNYRRIIM